MAIVIYVGAVVVIISMFLPWVETSGIYEMTAGNFNALEMGSPFLILGLLVGPVLAMLMCALGNLWNKKSTVIQILLLLIAAGICFLVILTWIEINDIGNLIARRGSGPIVAVIGCVAIVLGTLGIWTRSENSGPVWTEKYDGRNY